MGLVLFAGDDPTGPDVSWSHSGFHMYRAWLARAEGLTLSEMRGFGGDRTWSTVTSPLTPLLDHPDDDGVLTVAQCAAMLPRLEAISTGPPPEDDDPEFARRVADTRELVTVIRHCLRRNTELVFG
ncbi:hypothetical protein RM844_06080 [Streptomyces sp. DSM 44915]|uniref:Uncharacterized protein n=1 Tax=Streptomyces chisholmiae TaxID=3075540 RepID=A0ABU2JLJ2_9ACTN|nr:hypothetical protein [Streptomyces sp. DSM 44915]MDT0265856.1 hypothetical protein [Streptomyces sp. DSM 44915]